MKKLILVVTAAFCSMCSEAQTKWYEGGTLHQSTIPQWGKADAKNKLATAADWATIWITKKEPNWTWNDKEARVIANAIVTCIDEATVGIETISSLKNQKSTEMAAICIILIEAEMQGLLNDLNE